MYELPTSVIIDGKQYKIRNNGDYRIILDVIAACEDSDLNSTEQAVEALIIFYDDLSCMNDIWATFVDVKDAVNAMMQSISMNGANVGHTAKHKLIDWKQDEALIVSAINNVARTEIRALSYLHWWTFLGYYMAVGESSLSTVVSIRDKIAKHKKLEKYEQEFRKDNPQYFTWNQTTLTENEKAFEDEINENW